LNGIYNLISLAAVLTVAMAPDAALFEIALMVFLGGIKLGGRQNFGNDRLAPAPALL
jgi:hypothetical protein